MTSKTKGVITISRERYASPAYVMKQDRFQHLKILIIANWESCVDMYGVKREKNDRLKYHADKIKEMMQEKFGRDDNPIEVVDLYNKDKTHLMQELQHTANSIPVNGKGRPDMFLCFIVARGEESYFYEIVSSENGEKSGKIYFKDIADLFNGENCPGLVLRPKLFFIQTESGVPVSKSAALFSNIEPVVRPKPVVDTLPVEADFFMYTCISNCPDSRFIDCLCEELKEEQDIMDMTLKVNKKVHGYIGRIPLCTNLLTKQLRL